MGIIDWFKGANPATSVTQGAVTGVLDGVTKAANGIREAITGKLSADDQAAFDLKWQELTQVLQQGQMQINLADANSGSNFRGGWRPALGWICDAAIFFYYIPRFVLGTVFWSIACVKAGAILPMPEMGISDILGLIGTLLGSAGLRTYEKVKGVAD